MPLTLGTSPSTFKLINNLSRSTAELSSSLVRLSSGLRINSPVDDPGGFIISTKIKTDAIISKQAGKNINDGISYFSIAESATTALSGIASQLKDLASQASSSALTDTQRTALNAQFQDLRNEYNRIGQTTDPNGTKIFSTTALTNVSIQAENSSISSTLAGNYTSTFVSGDTIAGVGDGTFTVSTSTTVTGANLLNAEYADLNNDGALDIFFGNNTGPSTIVYLNNGDGTFNAPASYAAGAAGAYAADVDRDGALDLIGQGFVLINNGDGTFKARTTVAGNVNIPADFNRDGKIDLLGFTAGTGNLFVSFGNGDGTFGAISTFSSGAPGIGNVTVRDVNGDGIQDLLGLYFGGYKAMVLLGNLDGTFKAGVSYSVPASPTWLETGDLNGDGKVDLITTDGRGAGTNTIAVLFGNGDGTFGAATTFASGGTTPLRTYAKDLNGDGYLDLISANNGSGTTTVLLGNGNGTFKAAVSYAGVAGEGAVSIADFNGDGITDLIGSGGNKFQVLLGNGTAAIKINGTATFATLQTLDISTKNSALLTGAVIDAQKQNISYVSGQVSASLSRLQVAAENSEAFYAGTTEAYNKIVDVDVAYEVARKTRNDIIQQSTTALLAQANQSALLVLKLLDFSNSN